jgi:predicted nucleic acid-binding protein
MAVSYQIRAQVVDITTDRPTDKDTYLVDTNAWLWTTYSRVGQSPHPPSSDQRRHYPQYLANASGANAKLLRCGLSLAELAHLIEKTEREIYNKANNAQLSTKEFRHNMPTERTRVVAEIQAAWAQVKLIASDIEVRINNAATDSALTNFSRCALDGYDLFILEAMQRAGVNQIITDDGDYATVDGLQVFTCNRNVLNLARQQGKLIVR